MMSRSSLSRMMLPTIPITSMRISDIVSKFVAVVCKKVDPVVRL
jgi:hypothetical protein